MNDVNKLALNSSNLGGLTFFSALFLCEKANGTGL